MISASFCSCLGDRLLQFLRHLLTVRSECPHNSDTDFLHQISSIFKAHWSKKTFRRRLRLRLCLLLINSSLTSRPVPATDDSLVRSDFSNSRSVVRQPDRCLPHHLLGLGPDFLHRGQLGLVPRPLRALSCIVRRFRIHFLLLITSIFLNQHSSPSLSITAIFFLSVTSSSELLKDGTFTTTRLPQPPNCPSGRASVKKPV